MATYEAVTALPYPHLERARRGLAAQLRLQLLAAHENWFPAIDGMAVLGPEVTTDGRGREWWEYRATVTTPAD